jgi:hypothetical protein
MPNTRIGTLIPGHTWLEGVGVPDPGIGSKFQYYQDTVTRNLYQKQDAVTWNLIGNLSGNWLSGVGTPDPSLGIIGNFYVDTDTGDVFEKTDLLVWETRGTLISTGVWTSDNGAPLATDGNIGDFYTDLDDGSIYEKIDDVTWELRGTMIPVGVWTSGSGLPLPADGNVGDFYLDNDTKICYEKTDPVTWTFAANLTPPVVTGVWTSGNGLPVNTNGNIGDFYWNLTTGDAYEKTAALVWTFRADLTPPPQIITGVWTSGVGLPVNANGNIGDFYWDLTTDNVYEKTAALVWTFRVDLTPPPAVVVGVWTSGNGLPVNANGSIGDFYLNYANGDCYEKTAALVWTFRGDIMPPTPPTPVGLWFSGNGAPVPPFGSVNDYYVDLLTKNVYEQQAVNVWNVIGSLSGTQVGLWTSGAGAPVNTAGNIGDFYTNTTNKDVFEKTAALVWTYRGTLAGGGSGDTGLDFNSDLMQSLIVPTGWTLNKYNIILDTGATLKIDGRLYYRSLDSTNGTLDTTNGSIYPI